MADDWPFLHLNIIPPNLDALGTSSESQELSLLPFDPSHLEAWTNITFQFDEPNAMFNNPPSATGDNPTASNTSHNNPHTGMGHEIFHSSPEIQLQLSNDRSRPAFVASQSMMSESNNTHQLAYLDRPSNQQVHVSSHPCIDGTIHSNMNKLNVINQSAIEANQSMAPSKTNKSKQVDDHSSPAKNDPTSPSSHQSNGTHGSNDDDVANRIAHDEDKRRRNTLASARFRMKKKMKELEIERSAKEMRDRVTELEKEVDSLKQENKWLRGLIVDSTASKIVSVQAQETAELKHMESSNNLKRPNPVHGLTSNSISVPNYPQKRVRI